MNRLAQIIHYLDKQGVTLTTFERKTKISNGYFKNTLKRQGDVTQKILDRIRENAPDDYYKIFPGEKQEIQVSGEHGVDYFTNIPKGPCYEHEREISYLQQRVYDLETQIRDKNEIIFLQRGMLKYEDPSKASV